MADPAVWNITVRKNAPWDRESYLADEASGERIDLTGYDLLMQVRLYQGAADPALVDLETVETAVEGIQITDAPQGEFTILIDQATLEALPAQNGENKPSVFHHDLILTAPGGPPEVYAYGSFTVFTGVTR